MSNIQRKLTTILATDCVGYSKFMAENETKALESIKSCRKIIETTISEYGGRVFNTAGDSVIAEFNSPVDCVNASIDFQNLIKDRNKQNIHQNNMLFRVGIHLDDVIIEDQDIFGNGVNIAARLEGICQPGEILISQSVQDHINKKINALIEHIGDKKLKNIDGKIPVYEISISKEKYNHSNEIEIEIFENKKIRLFVLPFRNSNNDRDNGDLVDGIVEDLITEFSLIKDIEIMSNASTRSLKEREINLKEIKEEFGIDFFLTGSIRSSGKRVRFSVELLGADDANVLWSDKYDRILEDIFDVQDEIVRKVIFSLIGEIEIKTLERAERKPTENLNSYEYLLKGKNLHHKYTKESHPKALEYFNKALEIDPNNGAAYAWKACTVGGGISRGFFEETENLSKSKVKEWIDKALEINQNDFECYRMLCRVHLTVYGDHDKSIEFGKKAYSLNPNDPRILWGLGSALALSGNGEEALEYLLKAFELSPHIGVEGSADNIISAIILGYYSIKDYDNSIIWFKKLEISDFRSYVLYLSSLKYLGKELTGIKEFKNKYLSKEFKNDINLFRFKDDKYPKEFIVLLDEIL
jgi:adenylate cyclase